MFTNKLLSRGIFISLTLIFLSLPLVIADDVYKPYLHNPVIPEHPNLDVQGVYNADLWPGAATYSYSIITPPGTNGLQPIVTLNYNHQLTSQRPGKLGTAWNLNENYIYRDVDFSFEDTSDDKFNLVLNGQLYNLVYDVSDGRYHTEIESYLYIQNVSGGNNTKGDYWILKTEDGTSYRFGFNGDSELVSNIQDYVVKWSLDLVNDTHGNSIYYSYKEDPNANDLGTVYPYKIDYNNDQSRSIEFILESSDRPDNWIAYEQGNKIRESRRIKEIQITANEDLVRKYEINYTTLDTTGRSFIHTISLYGNDNSTSLSPVTFEYYVPITGWFTDEDFKLPSSELKFESNTYLDQGVRLLDFNRDGLMDVVRADGLNPDKNQSWVNNGTGWERDDSWNLPGFVVDGSDQNDTGLRFVDFNGDGFTDIVLGDGSTRKSWENSMTGWLGDNSSWHLPSEAHLINSSGGELERGVRFADINGDNLPDILLAYSNTSYVWENNGTGWEQSTLWEIPLEASFITNTSSGDDEGVRIVDINGDGLIDLIKANSSDRITWLNNGAGWLKDLSWNIPSNISFITNSSEDDGFRLVDFNGDELADLTKRKVDDSRETWLNNGTGWERDDSWNVPGPAHFVSSSRTNKGVRIVDVNGDGLVDLMVGEIFNTETFINKKAVKGYLLKNITNNLGGISSVDYMKSTDVNNTGEDGISDLGFNLWVVGKLLEENGINGAQNNSFTRYYSYGGGYYDFFEREFRGFNQVDEVNPGFSIIRHWFYQNDSLKGKEYQTEIFDENSLPYFKRDYEWGVEDKTNYYVVELSKETNSLYDGSNDLPKITQKEYSYDDYGNTLSISYLGDNSTQNDEKYEYFEYVYNTDDWIVNSLKHFSLYDYNNSTKIRETFYRYDNLGYGGSPTQGDLTWEEFWLDTGDNSIITYGYDSCGNLVNESDPRNKTKQYIYGVRDPTYTFVDRTINAEGHIFNYGYNLGTGNLLWETEANNQFTNYTYDVFGRITKETLPYDSESYPTKEYNYSLDGIAPEGIKVLQREASGTSDTLDNYYFYDGFGNLIQNKKEAENSQQIIGDFYYDGIKRIEKQSNPYFATESEEYLNPNISISTINYTYDPLSRVINIKNQDNSTKNIAFNHWEITNYNENGNKIIYSLDAYERVSRITEYSNENYFVTKYFYNAADKIIQINDSHDNLYIYHYDSIGRKTEEQSVDSGMWKYYYDSSGNLVTQTDNREINISLEYDGLNRLTEKNDSIDIISYIYDSFMNGTLWEVIDTNTTINYSYDNKLRKTKEERLIDGKIFTKQWTYDSMNRIQTETLPDSAVITYNYTTQGKINKISNTLDDVDYNSLNKPTKISYENTLDTDYTYNEDTYNVEKIKTDVKQELDYEYDLTGNVINITDNVNNFTISMIYDALNRLIYANKEGSNNFEYSYAYDFLGNVLKIFGKENLSLYHNLEPKHAPSLVTKSIVIPPNGTSKFIIKNDFGSNVSWFGSEGDIALIGTCNVANCESSPNHLFIIANSTDDPTAYVDSNGNLCIEKGSCSGSSSCNPSKDAFKIKNSTQDIVFYIDFDGELCFTGGLYENADL